MGKTQVVNVAKQAKQSLRKNMAEKLTPKQMQITEWLPPK